VDLSLESQNLFALENVIFIKNLKILGKQKYIILQHTLHHLAVIQVIDGIFRYKTEASILGVRQCDGYRWKRITLLLSLVYQACTLHWSFCFSSVCL